MKNCRRVAVALAHAGSGGFWNREASPDARKKDATARGREVASDDRFWDGFKLLPGMSRHEGEHRIGDIEDSVQLSSQVPQNSGRCPERVAMTEGHQTGKNSRMRQVRRGGVGISAVSRFLEIRPAQEHPERSGGSSGKREAQRLDRQPQPWPTRQLTSRCLDV